ncbi:MAG TPA: conjugal transfer protein TraX [Candidatus Mediterraneibacter pullicola]|uniref:Conjugal transfer protein TraX n=1 Tax=Candidatus Mediterraneibacter pullicola TaxID=2838682 RepID=A0A9D2KJJ5_9FIRM|nr:conjugal transfer protein TraX [Candidatus Mediterraneibacter pullicola]
MSEQAIMEGDHRYKIFNRDVIKYISMFTMLLNHIAQGFLTNGTMVYKLMQSIGYFTAPVMIYFLVEGYYYTHSRKKYFLRLFLFAVLSEFPFCLLFGLANYGRLAFYGMNMLFTLCLCFLLICAMENWSSNILKAGVIIAVFFVSRYFDWPYYAPLFTLLFLLARKSGRKPMLAASFAVPAVLFGVYYNIVPYILYVGVVPPIAVLYCVMDIAAIALAGVCIMCFYNGKRIERGRTFSKWFFYLFYPVHLTVLSLLLYVRL